MKKYFTFGLIMSLVSGACFAEHPMIAQLIQEKQQKMEKLEKCKGTTKNLKIAGISTLGITAVGIGANIAEAVVLDKTKDQVKEAREARDAQLEIKESRQEFTRFCNEIFGSLDQNGTSCIKYAADIDEYKSLVSTMRQKFGKCQSASNPLQERCFDKENNMVSIYLYTQNDQGSGQGEKEQNKETTQTHVIHKTLSLAEIANEVSEYLEKPEAKCSNKSTNLTWSSGYTWEITCDGINHKFTFDGVKCDNNQKFNTESGECLAEAETKKPLKQRCDEAFGNAGQERLACCYAGAATVWENNTCVCKNPAQEWKGGKCVAKPDNGNKDGNGGQGGQGGANGGQGGQGGSAQQTGPTERSFEISRKIKHDSVNQEINNFRYNAQIDPECQSSKTTYVGNYVWKQVCANHTYNVTIKNIDCGTGMQWNHVNNTCEQEESKVSENISVDTSMFESIRTKTAAQAAGLANLAIEVAGGPRNTCGVSGTKVTCVNGKYVFNFKSTSESIPNYYNGDITTVVCRIYGGTPTYGKINKYNACDYVDNATCNNMINAVTRGVATSVGTKYTNSRCEFTWQ